MGITFVEGRFVFDFSHDGINDIITLTGDGYEVRAFGKCFYYGYEFSGEVAGNVRTEFIKYLKFTGDLRHNPDLTDFIKSAVDSLHKKINLYNYDLVVLPESSSDVNDYMLRYIYRFAQPNLQEMQLVKNLPKNIDFDMAAYESQYPDKKLEELCSMIRNQNILIIDDVTTSGSTLNEILRTLRILNEDNEITIFSLIGRKDLMAFEKRRTNLKN
ncbi:MAG: phosphoribosyltransferase [Bacteroidales bacterium]|nr:phosphoribosyltransferase [Bacteroidales bacterium]